MDSPLISIIVTCKNRLHHLRESLPRMLAQSGAETLVVDYGCQQGTRDWVRSLAHPAARCVAVDDDPQFCLSRARNLGAFQARGTWLLFVDADILIDGDLGAWIGANARPGQFCTAGPPRKPSTAGSVACERSAFDRVGGYDEAMRGWAWEDFDFYSRLRAAGLTEAHFPPRFLDPIAHGNEERQFTLEQGGLGSRDLAMTISRVYVNIKRDMSAVTGVAPPLDLRQRIMTSVREAVHRLHANPQLRSQDITVQCGAFDNELGFKAQRKLIYSLTREG